MKPELPRRKAHLDVLHREVHVSDVHEWYASTFTAGAFGNGYDVGERLAFCRMSGGYGRYHSPVCGKEDTVLTPLQREQQELLLRLG